MINKEEIHRLVEVFYQPPFKTFYINSVDGETFVKPAGVFVSLGITTSLRVLQDIKRVLQESNNLVAALAEIKSVKIGGQFLNYVIPMDESEVSQFDMDVLPEGCFKEKESKDLLVKMKEELINGKGSYGLQPVISKLTDLIQKLDSTDGWENHLIQKINDDFRIYHKKVNYKKDTDGIEYRIGIFVEI